MVAQTQKRELLLGAGRRQMGTTEFVHARDSSLVARFLSDFGR